MSATNKSMYVGIDCSKGYADIIAFGSNKEIAEPAFRLYDITEGYRQLQSLIARWLDIGFEHIYCGVESTGGYENNWVNYLQQMGKNDPVHIARLNPKGVKSLGEARLTRTITDSVSAENIALYLMDHPGKVHYLKPSQTSKAYSEGRKHNSFIRMLKKQRNQLGNQLEKLLYEQLPPLMCYCRHGQPLWLLLMLEKYATAASIKKAGVSKLSKIKGISEEKAKSVVAKLTGSDIQSSDHIGSIIKSTAAQILHLEGSIKKEKLNLYSRFKHTEEAVLLTSITGIGEQSAVEILVEIEDINRFETAKKLGAYFGTHPMWKQSGDGTWGNHMSKKGRSEIRGVLYMCGMSAVRHDEMFKGIYARARAKGKNHFSAMGVVMNKMLRIIYGVLKNKTKYNREIDYKNQQNAQTKQKQQEQKQEELKQEKQTKLERYNLREVSEMPVSKRYAKKKKQSPKLQPEECTGSSAS
ncbi:MAG: IS110 family transposase [Chitinophagaceae bacterium]|nr:IS110 family transposase [Chitinophagaceae bacterium]